MTLITSPTTAPKWNCAASSLSFLYESSAEAAVFLTASLAMRIFVPPLAAPLLGISLSVIATRLVLKICDRYNSTVVIHLTKEACKFNKRHPQFQRIAFVFSLAISFLSRTCGFIGGIILGSFGAILLEVENYKLLQRANRHPY